MKWTKLRTDPDLSQMNAIEKACFKIYDDFKKAKSADGPQIQGIIKGAKGKVTVSDTFNVWNKVGSKIGYAYPKTGFGRNAREKYENFCGGWLGFYDDIVRNGTKQHTLHFEWDKKNHRVIIWISPPAKDRPEKKYQDYIKYLPVVDPPNTPPPPPPPRDL